MTAYTIDKAITLFLNGSSNIYIDHWAQTATQTITWIPLAVLLVYILIRHNDLVSFVELVLAIALCILIADQVASSICKPIIARFRPAQDPYIMFAVDVVSGYRGGLYGFFSSHAANTFAVSTFLILLMKNRILTYWLLSWAIINCWTRAYLGVHYASDLAVGAIWGTATGYFIYQLWLRFCHHSEIWKKTHQEENAIKQCGKTPAGGFTLGGYSISSIHLLCAGIAATYLYISLKATWLNL